jgi:hypothetical protein
MMHTNLRLVYGVILAALLLVPFGVYHSGAEAYVTGSLWGYNLPIGYVGLISGVLAIIHPKIGNLKKMGFGSFMTLIGIFLLLLFVLSPKDYFINLIHGTCFDSVDVDYPVGNSAVLGLSPFSIVSGLMLGTYRVRPTPSRRTAD